MYTKGVQPLINALIEEGREYRKRCILLSKELGIAEAFIDQLGELYEYNRIKESTHDNNKE